MKFVLITFLLASSLGSIQGDFTDAILKTLEKPDVQYVIGNFVGTQISKTLTNTNNEREYSTRDILCPNCDDPLIVDDGSIILAPDGPLGELVVGNLTGCSVEILGLTTVTNYTRAILLPFPVKLDLEIRASELMIHGRHLIDLSLPQLPAATFHSFGEFNLALHKGFAGLRVEVTPFFLPFDSPKPIEVNNITFNVGFESFSLNAAETLLGETPVPYDELNANIKPLFDDAIARLKISLEPMLLRVVQGALAKCTVYDLLSKEPLKCILDPEPRMNSLFETKNEELIAQCLEGPMLETQVPGSSTTPNAEATTPTGPTTDATEGSTTENFAAVLKSETRTNRFTNYGYFYAMRLFSVSLES